MKIYTIHEKLKLPITLDIAWDFFCNPANLKVITPDYMGFDVKIIHEGKKMYSGMIIAYTVKPLLNIPMTWVTEIKNVTDHEFFIDEQRFGPYSFWHHKHFFTSVEGGVLMEDLVHYVVPMGMFGRIAHPFLVKPSLEKIFGYRKTKMQELFGTLD
ncbi:MAG: SRPBCC family protein [Bacteroidota bacterium]|nr:SRPBCC family protein [Bacteroidota bacterium]